MATRTRRSVRGSLFLYARCYLIPSHLCWGIYFLINYSDPIFKKELINHYYGLPCWQRDASTRRGGGDALVVSECDASKFGSYFSINNTNYYCSLEEKK